MKEILQALGWLVFAFYLISFGYYVSYFKTKKEHLAHKIRAWLMAGMLFHTLYIVLLGFKLGHLPVGDIYEVLTTCAWFFVLVYLALEIRLKEMTMLS